MSVRPLSKPWYYQVALLVALSTLTACDTAPQKKTVAEVRESQGVTLGREGPAQWQGKIHPKIAAVLQTMLEEKRTRTGEKSADFSMLSTPFLRVDEKGKIHAYIYVSEIGEGILSELRARGVLVEITDQPLNIIQAWVPFEKMAEVAQLEFVIRITPPSYGVLR